MNQSEAQAKYKEFRDKIKATEKPGLIGMAAGLERLQLKNDLNHFRLQCADEGIILLEPCPFCGNYEVKISNSGIGRHFALCLECKVTTGFADEIDQAIAAWNTRVN